MLDPEYKIAIDENHREYIQCLRPGFMIYIVRESGIEARTDRGLMAINFRFYDDSDTGEGAGTFFTTRKHRLFWF